MISFHAYGHPNITATHETTIEVTKDTHLTKRGDCIIGVSATKGLRDLKNFLEENKKQEIVVTFVVGDLTERVKGYLDPRLTFRDGKDIVIRKSSYICDRTLMVHADKAAAELERPLVQALKGGERMTVSISIY